MRILHVSNKPAYPRIDGGTIAISEMLKALSEFAEVTHFTLSTHKHPFNRALYPSELNLAGIYSATIDTKLTLKGASSSLFKNESYNVVRFFSKTAALQLNNIIEEFQPEIAVLESIYLLPYLSIFKDNHIKVVVRTHNIEHQIWEQKASSCINPIKCTYLKKLARQLKTFELQQLNQVDGIIAISSSDAAYFEKYLKDIPIVPIPTPFETSETVDYQNTELYFLGAMDWPPNHEGVEWFLREVFPLLKGETFHLAGKHINCDAWKKDGIQCHGEVPSAKKFIDQHGICLIPLQSGGGVKIKLLENMANGKPIVTTPEGTRGVELTHRKEVLIANTPKEFAECIESLKQDPVLRKQLGEAAQQFVRDHYSTKKLASKTIDFLHSI